jgi:phage gp29-like protein
MEDDRLLAQVRTARFTIQLAAFSITKGEKKLDDLHELFEKTWFDDYLTFAVDTELYGHSLIEFYSASDHQYFDKIELIPRENVKPEKGIVVLRAHDIKGFSFRENKYFDNLVEIGRDDDYGLLLAISKMVIKKDYSLTDWSRRNERFGMPFTTVKTASRDKAELDNKEDMLKNFGANMWAILDDQDEITMIESSQQGNAHLSFKDLAAYVDEGIAMLVNGQTSTSDQKAYVGSAEVHERILNKYTLARMRRIQNHINEGLLPFLVKHGYPLEGCTFHFHDLLQEDKETTQTPPDPKKKK